MKSFSAGGILLQNIPRVVESRHVAVLSEIERQTDRRTSYLVQSYHFVSAAVKTKRVLAAEIRTTAIICPSDISARFSRDMDSE